jgi:hypothetical protein
LEIDWERFIKSDGNKKYKRENAVTGTLFIFISLIQLMDFLFWIDIKNEIGINKITTIIGPILNICQPIILFLIKYFYYKPTFNFPIILLNLIYFVYFIIVYSTFLLNDKLITGVKNGHLNWPWIKYANPQIYLVLLAINIFYLFDYKYALTFFIITYLFLFISVKYFYYNAGELWCFFGAFIPLIMLFLSFYI